MKKLLVGILTPLMMIAAAVIFVCNREKGNRGLVK